MGIEALRLHLIHQQRELSRPIITQSSAIGMGRGHRSGRRGAAQRRLRKEGQMQQLTQPNLKQAQEGFTRTQISKEMYKRKPDQTPFDAKDLHENVIETVIDQTEALKVKHPNELVEGVFKHGEFQMQGVALVSAYLAAKKNVKGLYVCETLEAFRSKLEEIGRSKEDVRVALVVPADSYASHKVAVCVEKKGQAMKIALLETLGIDEDEIDLLKVLAPATQDELEDLDYTDTLLWYIYHSKIDLAKTEIYYASSRRQITSFSCETFAIRGSLAFLQNPKFFEEVLTRKVVLEEEGFKIELHDIKVLPLEFMVGTQWQEALQLYLGAMFACFLKDPVKNIGTIPKIQTLMRRIHQHTIQGEQNQYINERSDKYFLLALELLKQKNTEELKKMLATTLVKP